MIAVPKLPVTELSPKKQQPRQAPQSRVESEITYNKKESRKDCARRCQKFELKCRHYLLICFVVLAFISLIVELSFNYYFDGQIKTEGLKVAAKLGAEFESQLGSPYFNQEQADLSTSQVVNGKDAKM